MKVNLNEIDRIDDLTEENISYFEHLPHDVFVYLILVSNVDGADLINLCDSSDAVYDKCRYRNDELFMKVLEQKYQIIPKDIYVDPEDVLRLIDTSIWDSKVSKVTQTDGNIDLIVPNKVLEAFLKELGKADRLNMNANLIYTAVSNNNVGLLLLPSAKNPNTFVLQGRNSFSFENDAIDNKIQVFAKLPPSFRGRPGRERKITRYLVNGILMTKAQKDGLINLLH